MLKLSLLVVAALLLFCGEILGYHNLIGTDIHKCLNCLCHARSGCSSTFSCGRYSISREYWGKSGSPSTGTFATASEGYIACMRSENCILNTIKSYTESFGQIDCNCDGRFDCKDRFAIHLFGKDCKNPKYGRLNAKKFNNCAARIGISTILAVESSCVGSGPVDRN